MVLPTHTSVLHYEVEQITRGGAAVISKCTTRPIQTSLPTLLSNYTAVITGCECIGSAPRLVRQNAEWVLLTKVSGCAWGRIYFE